MAVSLKVKAIKAKPMKIDQVRREVLKQLEAEGKEVEKLLDQTTATWKSAKPTFQSTATVIGDNAVVATSVGGNAEGVKKWNILNEGARRHPIRARRKKTLAFRRGGFRPKTRVKRLKSVPGSPASGPMRFPVAVRHPGIKARQWNEVARQKRVRPFQRNVQIANNRAVSKIYG